MPGSRGAWTPDRAGVRFVSFISAAFAVVLLATISPARADEPFAEPIVFTYATEEGCPTELHFVTSVRRYTTRWRAVDSGAGLRSFEVRLTRRGANHVGSFIIRTADSEPSTREIVGPDCAAVTRALAVAVALAIDPAARIGGPDREVDVEPAPPAPDGTPSSDQPETPPSPSPAATAPPAPSVPQRARPRTVTPPRAPARKAFRLAFAAEARAELTTAVVRGTLPVAAAAFAVRAEVDAWPSWLTPSLAIGFRHSLSKEIGIGPGASEFTWTAATFRLCPVRFTMLRDRLAITPCAELDVGALRADTRGLANALSTSTSWFDRGASLRATYQLSRAWAAGAGLAVIAPATRNRFAVESGELISRAPAAGVTGGLLLELSL